jgi:peptide/nickel transport system substrate-binding protein/oligopeptide transport system substrate-binding protein
VPFEKLFIGVRRWKILPIVVIFGISGVCSGSATGEEAPSRIGTERQGGTYRRPLAGSPVTLDPVRINDIYSRTIANQLFDGLVQLDGALAIRPAIAETWTASRDGLVWTFRLKKGVKFHHGREVSADDFVYSLTRIVDPRIKSSGVALFMKIRGAREFAEGRATRIEGLVALDPHTLQITLTESPTVVPREIVEKLGEDFGRQPVGTGPFKFVEWVRDKQITLAANPDYFEGRPYLDRLEYRIFVGNVLDRMLAEFERGNLEDAEVPARERPRLLNGRRYQFVQRPILGVTFLGINTTQKPLDDPRIRQAINYAIDRRTIMREIYQDQYLPGAGILPPATPGYNSKIIGYPYDPKKAAELLVAAGYPGGKGLPVLHIWSSRKNDEAVAEHEAIFKYLAAVGVRAEVHYNTNWPEYKAQVYAGKLSIFRYSWYADTPDAETFLGQLFDSRSPDNITRFRNAGVDTLIQRARLESDAQRKLLLYQEAERQIVGYAPLVVLSYSSYERVFQPYVKGIQVSPMGDRYIPMKKIWLER